LIFEHHPIKYTLHLLVLYDLISKKKHITDKPE